jgi:hypothetical protein
MPDCYLNKKNMQTKLEIPTGYNWHVVMIRMFNGVLECSLYGSCVTEKEARDVVKHLESTRMGWNFLAFRQSEK